MAVQKPSIPKGTRDFGPETMARRGYIFDTIKAEFKRFGFAEIETPTMENLSTLLGKYGEEGDKLLFKVLNSGDFLDGVSESDLKGENKNVLATKICEKGLRYDLTVPFARYVVQHQNELTFPFKRFQIQPVWRADRPQKGRYREFCQCDIDIIGSDSMINEVELIQVVERVFNALKVNVVLKLNNRKILFGIAEVIGHADKMIDITVAIDKLDKIGIEEVNKELIERGICADAVGALQPILNLSGTNREKLTKLGGILATSEVGLKGITEMTEILDYVEALEIGVPLEIDLSLARGLNYYTGAIFEVKATDHAIGSICGGGRYDDLTGIFGMSGMSGVGISFGADRIYDVMNGLELFPADVEAVTEVMFVNFGAVEAVQSMKLMTQLRNQGLRCEIYPDSAKMKKQMDYANKRGVKFVVIIGENEMKEGVAVVKNMMTGQQNSVKFAEFNTLTNVI